MGAFSGSEGLLCTPSGGMGGGPVSTETIVVASLSHRAVSGTGGRSGTAGLRKGGTHRLNFVRARPITPPHQDCISVVANLRTGPDRDG